MKKSLFFPLLVLFAACSAEPKETLKTGDELPVQELSISPEKLYQADSQQSYLKWTGSEGLGNIVEAHYGNLPISAGSISVKEDDFSGSFEVEVAGLTVSDITKESSNKKLTSHLLGEDFLDAAQFPKASFQIVSVAPAVNDSVDITGNLTMKGVTKSITFPALVAVSDTAFSAKADFYINRKDWGMHYRTEESLGDKLIRPEVLIEINLVAKPQV